MLKIPQTSSHLEESEKDSEWKLFFLIFQSKIK